MPSPITSYTLPKTALIRWLTEAGRDVPQDVHSRLLAGFFTSTFSLLAAEVANTMVNVAAVIRHPATAFVALLAVDIFLLVGRVILLKTRWRAARQSRPTHTDLFFFSSVAWPAMVGIGTALCFATGDPVLQFIAPTTMMGIIAGAATRNNGAPRLAVCQVLLCVVPLIFVIPLAPDPWTLVALGEFPLFLLALTSAIYRLNRGYVAVVMAERNSERRSVRDHLTDLLNRAGLTAALSQELAHAKGRGHDLAILYLDLDGFKSVNDQFGHAAGDELLRQIASRLVQTAPEADMIGRLGGDEFVVLAPRRDAGEAAKISEAILSAVSLSYDVGIGPRVKIGVSIGIACASPDSTIASLLAEADAALFEAKRSGKGRWVLAESRATGLCPSRNSLVA